MPLQSINNNRTPSTLYMQLRLLFHSLARTYVLTSDMEMHVNNIICWWFFISHSTQHGGCIVSYFRCFFFFGCFGDFQAHFQLFFPFRIGKLCKCAGFCMFHDHVCVFVQIFMCSLRLLGSPFRAVYRRELLPSKCMLQLFYYANIITMCFTNWVYFCIVATFMGDVFISRVW